MNPSLRGVIFDDSDTAEEEIMTSARRKWTQPDGHALSSERTIGASAAAIFDAFIALYDSQRPDR